MRNHLSHVHKNLKGTMTSGNDLPVSSRRQSLKAMHASKKEIGSKAYENLNKCLALFVALDLRPLSTVEGEGFRNFVVKIDIYKRS